MRSGGPYELSNGRPICCNPTGKDGTGPNGFGFAVLNSDPLVKNAGVDTGIDLGKQTLRAPDIAVNFEGGTGPWATSTALAVEYAGQGRDEAEQRSAERWREEGREEGASAELRATLRRVLALRKLAVADEHHARIEACAERSLLARWLDRAVLGASVDGVFA